MAEMRESQRQRILLSLQGTGSLAGSEVWTLSFRLLKSNFGFNVINDRAHEILPLWQISWKIKKIPKFILGDRQLALDTRRR